MNKNLFYTGAVFLFVFAISPAVSFAQTTGIAQDGSTEPTVVRQERIRGYRHQSSDFQNKISALGNTAEQIVFMPVLFGIGVNNIFPNFGDPRDGGARTHEGEDIMAVKGTPIVSPTPAVVLRTGVGAGEGNYVYTANPGGETFVYMHLDRIGEGVTSGTLLSQGSLIGYVGNTGNASEVAAHLHFEIHNSSGTPTDPFLRLTGEFTPAQKILYLTAIFGIAADPVTLSQFLVANFRSTFTSAVQSGITLPPLITGALASVANAPPASGNLPTGRPQVPPQPADDLALGSSGSAVVTLQKFLILKSAGPSAMRLASAGATGYFGPITESALVEYQISAGITPANGYYGPATRVSVAGAPAGIIIGPDPGHTPPLPGSTDAGIGLNLPRNLYQGISGEDVRSLQRTLNTHGYTVASSGAGSLGNETIYFGPATQSAVIKFQIARGIAPAVGYVGPITRTTLSAV